jgi:hypothetical protein
LTRMAQEEAALVRLHERLRAAQKATADASARARAAASAAADEAQRTVANRRKATWTLEEFASLPSHDPAATSGEELQLEEMEDDVEMLRDRLRSAKTLWKRVIDERDQLSRRLAAYGGSAGVAPGHFAWKQQAGAADDGHPRGYSTARRLTAEEREKMVVRLSRQPKGGRFDEEPPEAPVPTPMPRQLGPRGWVERDIKPLPREQAMQRLYTAPMARQVQREELMEEERGYERLQARETDEPQPLTLTLTCCATRRTLSVWPPSDHAAHFAVCYPHRSDWASRAAGPGFRSKS